MAKKKKSAKRKPAKKRSGLTVVGKSGKRKRPRKRSGFLKNPNESLKSAFMAAGAIRAASGAAGYAAKMNNQGNALPKVKMIVPALITGAAYAGAIPQEYLFAGAMATTDAAVENTPFLKKIFDFEFLPDMTKPKSGMIVREIPRRMYEIPARSGMSSDGMQYRQGGSMNDLMSDRTGGTYQR